MTPFETAFTAYDDESRFWLDLHAHLATGYVHSTPEYFVMARPVLSSAPAVEIANAWKTWPNPDAWFVWWMAGDMAACWRQFPFPLPLIGFARREGPARFYSFDRVKSLAKAS